MRRSSWQRGREARLYKLRKQTPVLEKGTSSKWGSASRGLKVEKERQLFLPAHAVPAIQTGTSGLQAAAQQKCWFFWFETRFLSEEANLLVDAFNYFRVHWWAGALFSAATVRGQLRDLPLPRDTPDS